MRLIIALLIFTVAITYVLTYAVPFLKRYIKSEASRIDSNYKTKSDEEEEK